MQEDENGSCVKSNESLYVNSLDLSSGTEYYTSTSGAGDTYSCGYDIYLSYTGSESGGTFFLLTYDSAIINIGGILATIMGSIVALLL
jgi:hypothetical protein